MIGRTILHYNIQKKLGEGGMGIVYLAEDTKLKRKVAIKFLPHSISVNNEEKQRFEIEAQAAASLNHPSIALIYSIEEPGEEIFIVMEYIEGKELKDIIERKHVEAENIQPLPIEDIIDYAIQTAEGLEAAHKKGIIHRDIKSSNIMVTEEGKIKIMDFGLAKIKGGTQLTKIGTTIGTAAYMSPEQARGEEVDHQTDIWSFGVVLYELVTGTLPFVGDYEQATIYSILNEKQKPVSLLNKDVSKEIKYIINKSLEKDPEKRFEDFSEILTLLKNLQIDKKNAPALNSKKIFKRKFVTITSVILVTLLIVFVLWKLFSLPPKKVVSVNNQVKRMAVLPFDNIKNDPSTNYLGFALADQIIGSLAYVKNIIVRPSSSIRPYENKDITPVKAGNQLKVDYILDGSYLKNAGIIRLNLELVNVHNDEIVWRNDFDEKYENTFKLQDLVSKEVTTGLKVKFASNKINTSIPGNSHAYENYLKAISMPSTMEGERQAVSLLKRALRLDSTYAPAYVLLGKIYDYFTDFDPTEKGMRKAAETAFLKALSLNSNSLPAMNGLAGLYTESGKDFDAVKMLKRALKINPDNPGAHFRLGYIFRYTGLQDKAVEEMEKARELDQNDSEFTSICITYVYSQRYEKALQVLIHNQNNPFDLAWKGQIYLRMKKIELAKQYLRKAVKIDSAVLGHWASGMLYYIENKRNKAINALKIMNKSNVYDGEVYYNYANLYALLGDRNDCVRFLRIAINHGFFNYQVMLKDSFLDSVRNDPAFKKTLKEAKKDSDKFKDELIDNSLLS